MSRFLVGGLTLLGGASYIRSCYIYTQMRELEVENADLRLFIAGTRNDAERYTESMLKEQKEENVRLQKENEWLQQENHHLKTDVEQNNAYAA